MRAKPLFNATACHAGAEHSFRQQPEALSASSFPDSATASPVLTTPGPLISVIIPCFNGERFIGEAIASVLRQTYTHIELIVVDDGSSDHSQAVVKKYAEDDRVRLLLHDANRGIPAARNTGIRASKGDWVAFLDQDDLWLPTKLEMQMAAVSGRRQPVGLVFTDLMVERDGAITPVRRARDVPTGLAHRTHGEVLEALFMYNFVPIVTALVARQVLSEIGLFDESLTGGADDWDLCLRIAAAYSLVFVPAALAVRKEHSENYSHIHRFLADHERILQKAVVQHTHLASLLPKRQADDAYVHGRYHQERGELREARAAFLQAMRAQPFHPRAVATFCLCFLGPLGTKVIKMYHCLVHG